MPMRGAVGQQRRGPGLRHRLQLPGLPEPYRVGAYFRKDFVTIRGDAATWDRTAESGRRLTNHFSPRCGSTVYWSLEMRPDHYGVAGGNMVTPLPEPQRAIWTSEKHDWVSFPDTWPMLEFGSPPS